MLIVKHFPERPVSKGQYLVMLDTYVDIEDERPGEINPWRNRFGYYCDKEHLMQMYLELKRVVEPIVQSELGLVEYYLEKAESHLDSTKNFVNGIRKSMR
jgi:hypothetical protein